MGLPFLNLLHDVTNLVEINNLNAKLLFREGDPLGDVIDCDDPAGASSELAPAGGSDPIPRNMPIRRKSDILPGRT